MNLTNVFNMVMHIGQKIRNQLHPALRIEKHTHSPILLYIEWIPTGLLYTECVSDNLIEHPLENKNIVLNSSCNRLASILASNTLVNAKFPIAQHGLRLLVPEFIWVHEEHFRPKWHTHPSLTLPRRIVAMAVLGFPLVAQSRICWKSGWT